MSFSCNSKVVENLPKEWKTIKIGDIAEVVSGYAFKRNDFVEKGVPVIKIKNIIPPFISIGDVQYITKDLYMEKIKYKLEYNDVLISLTGSNVNQFESAVGKVGRIRIKNQELILNQRVGKFVVNKNKYDTDFLYYNIATDETKWSLASSAGGSANQANISPSHIKNLVVPCPPLEEQKAIASILSALDDKIELNNQINKNLEEMAQAIFKHWFIDFEFPDENGESYKSSGGEMVESELGLIPKGWEVNFITEIADIAGGGTPSKKRDDYYTNMGIPWFTPKDLSEMQGKKFVSRGKIDITELGLRESSAKLLPKGTILFSSRAPIGYIAVAKNEVSTNQGFKSLIPKEGVGTEFIYYLLKIITPIIENLATGSTFKEISGGAMKKLRVIIPNQNVLNKFECVAKSLSMKVLNNEEQIETLTKMRDYLLPKLMSGEIRVPLDEIS